MQLILEEKRGSPGKFLLLMISTERLAYTKVPGWNGKKLRIPLEDDAIVTTRGIEWLYPVNRKILVVK